MSITERPVAAFVLSLIGGVFILLGAVIMSMFAFGTLGVGMTGMTDMMGMMGGMMAGMYGGMGMGVMMGFSPVLAVVGFASGILVILGSLMVYSRPGESQLWGALILAFSLASFLGGMGGFLVGLILGVVGGTLALTWKARPQTASS